MTATTQAYTSAWLSQEDTRLLGKTAAQFFADHLVPAHDSFEKQGHVSREFWQRAGEIGLLCCSIPDCYGGGGGTIAHDFVVLHEQARSLDLGWGNNVHSSIVAHYLLAYAGEDQKRRWLPRMASGDWIGSVAMSEPGAGSDLKAIKTRAVRQPDGGYRLTGAKTFITNGAHADLIVVVATTAPERGARGISLFVVETADCAGFRRGRVLDKVGMHCGDTCELFFDEVYVPAEHLLGGSEGEGFAQLSTQLIQERLLVGVMSAAVAERAVEETVAYTKNRRAFDAALFDMQNTRFELAECATQAQVCRVFVDSCVDRHLAGTLDAAGASMAKYWSSDVACQVIDRCLQLHGGYGYMREYPIARLYADARAQRIYGGANEIMKELIARSL